MVCSLLGPAIVKKFGINFSIAVGFIALAFLCFAQIFTALYHDDYKKNKPGSYWLSHKAVLEVILYIGSAISGVGQAVIWVAQGEYMSSCATERTQGFYFGYFWVWYMNA
jgi:hypothetical protein